ncbi:Hypothetical predicted protein [Paramuricea clavata]|uniref:Uncharacterized protein n=1 Tax=Paramuricea clavata TaxID=317549 RepID=A0A6S7HI54_PARCT|nr:Hypothetical predicted protein [Paramuricea clavata]
MVQSVFVVTSKLHGGKKFSKIDLRQAYHQIELEEESKKYLTINTSMGLFQYNRLVFGIISAPANWQRTMDQTLEGTSGISCILDDMIVTGKSDAEHMANLEKVLRRLHHHGLRANKSKCELFKEKITFCGHDINSEGLHKTTDKTAAMVNAPRPQSVAEVRSFLGLVNNYHKYLPNLATILHPLNQMLENLVLTHYDPNLPLQLACAASPVGIGAVLSHVMADGTGLQIAFASRSLSKAERNYAPIDKEALAKAFLLSLLLDYNATLCSWRVLTIQLDTRTLSYTGMRMVCLEEEPDPVGLFYATQFERLPVTAEQVKRETQRDPLLVKVHELVMKGWSTPQDEAMLGHRALRASSVNDQSDDTAEPHPELRETGQNIAEPDIELATNPPVVQQQEAGRATTGSEQRYPTRSHQPPKSSSRKSANKSFKFVNIVPWFCDIGNTRRRKTCIIVAWRLWFHSERINNDRTTADRETPQKVYKIDGCGNISGAGDPNHRTDSDKNLYNDEQIQKPVCACSRTQRTTSID